MPLKEEYEREFFFDIDAYLIEWYPKMNMTIRRAICSAALEVLDTEELELVVDECVNDYAKQKTLLEKKEDDEDDD